VDVETFRPDLDGSPIRARYGIGEEEMVVGFVGSFGRWHGTEVLAEAFCRLLRSKPEWRERVRLLLVGAGDTLASVKSILEENGGFDRTVFCGTVAQAEAPAHLAACDVLASPHVPNPDGSRFFGSPTKIFEYKASGRPVVASALEQVGELFHHGKTGWLVKPGSAADLERGIMRLLEDQELRIALGRAARKEAETHHTWRRHVERILERLART
jgi:glycosyltransferase involved in cell wall biosynthesis